MKKDGGPGDNFPGPLAFGVISDESQWTSAPVCFFHLWANFPKSPFLPPVSPMPRT